MNAPIEWLLTAEPWTVYRVLSDLQGLPDSDLTLQASRQDVIRHPRVHQLLTNLADWPGPVLTSHKSAGHPLHALTFLADIGLQAGDPGISELIQRILATQAPEGPFRMNTNIPVHFGGSGQDQLAWALCDAPLNMYALIQFGLGDRPEVQSSLRYLAGLSRDNGWPCIVSKELGRFRGPGRKEDPCPYATLIMLKCLALLPEWNNSTAAQDGAETLLDSWSQSRERHPYMFFMGTDFRKLKAPLVWYDVMHVVDVLSRFSWAHSDPRLLDMWDVISAQADGAGRYTPGSIWTAWKDWDFGQKKVPSPWLTVLAWSIQKRLQAG